MLKKYFMFSLFYLLPYGAIKPQQQEPRRLEAKPTLYINLSKILRESFVYQAHRRSFQLRIKEISKRIAKNLGGSTVFNYFEEENYGETKLLDPDCTRILYMDPDYDITQKVIDQLNQEYPVNLE